jgi:tubulin alpha
MPSTYVITGTSEGIGLELVKQLAARGEKIYACVRKKESSADGVDKVSSVAGDVTIIEGIDIMQDDVGEKLKAVLKDVTIDYMVHNAGGINSTGGKVGEADGFANMADQKFENVTTQNMMSTFNLNALGPLRVQQALLPMMKSPGGKVCIVSTGMGSIGDNGSGGFLAYRTSKAAVNMIAKGMSVELKDKGIAVMPISPNMVTTKFMGPTSGPEAMGKMGAMPVEKSVAGLIKAFDGLSMETTGRFMTVPKDGSDPCEFGPGW